MEALLYCCCGLDVHRDIIKACILRGTNQVPEIICETFSTAPAGQELLKILAANGHITE